MSLRKTVPKAQSVIVQAKMKDNSSYMSTFKLNNEPLQLQGLGFVPMGRLPTTKMIKDQQLVQNVRNMMKYEKIEDNLMNSNFDSIKTKPIISKQPIKPFIEDYPLNDNEKLKVCQTKVFVLKNYLNFLQQQQIQKSMMQIEEKNKNIENTLINQKYEHQIAAANSYKQNRSTIKKQQQILDPKHLKYDDKTESFHPKEKIRMQMSKNIFNSNVYSYNPVQYY